MLDFNTHKAFKYLNYELKKNCSKELIYKVYKDIRIVISKFLSIDYESNRLGYLNENKYFEIDEYNILNIGNTHIWFLGIIDTENKNFRLSPTFSRDGDNLNNFISKHIEQGNHIITEGWAGYDFLERPNSGYQRIKHIHGSGDFGYGRESTSHKESTCLKFNQS